MITLVHGCRYFHFGTTLPAALDPTTLGYTQPCSLISWLGNSIKSTNAIRDATRTNPTRQTEHIDNPKGYGDGEDARKYHPKLRGPVDPRELEIDPQTGMKNYIANGMYISP